MQILQLQQKHLTALRDFRFLIVESQEFGQPSDFRYHTVVNNNTAVTLMTSPLTYMHDVRIVKDEGRTIGYWQRVGGKGVFRPDLAKVVGFPTNIQNILGKCQQSIIRVEGKTWKAILKSIITNDEVLIALGVNERKVGRKHKLVDKMSTTSNK